MADQTANSKFYDMLIRRRNEIFDRRRQYHSSWQNLHEAERELEEAAQKENISQGLAQLDGREKDEIEAIDRALQKLEGGRYGVCEGCGEEVPPERLEALPYTPFCSRCATRLEKGRPLPVQQAETEAGGIPVEYQGMSDDQLSDAIYDELERRGRVETEELDVHVEEGVVHLDGVLPSETKRQILIELVEDVMGFPEVVDNLRIDRTLWQRGEAVRKPSGEKTDEEILMDGEDINEDPFDSEIDGTPLSPPDHMTPER